MEAVAEYSGPIISDIHDGRFLTGSYLAPWFQPVDIPEIYGGRHLCLDPNNIEYYLVSEEERQIRLENERRWSFSTSSFSAGDINWEFVIPDDIRVGDTLQFVGVPRRPPDE